MEAVEDEQGQADARDDAPRQEPIKPVHKLEFYMEMLLMRQIKGKCTYEVDKFV